MKNIIALLLLLASFSAFSEPVIGSYYIQGIAYSSDSSLMINQEIKVVIHTDTVKITTNNKGEFSTKIFWSTWDYDAGPPRNINDEIITYDEANESYNPPLIFIFNNKSIIVPNNWNEKIDIFIKNEQDENIWNYNLIF